jgi:hypothetical protein
MYIAYIVKFCFLNVLFNLFIALCIWFGFTSYCCFQRRARNELFVTLSVNEEDCFMSSAAAGMVVGGEVMSAFVLQTVDAKRLDHASRAASCGQWL